MSENKVIQVNTVMKLKFKHQKFQEEAAAAVCDVFAGQPNISSTYIIDKGR